MSAFSTLYTQILSFLAPPSCANCTLLLERDDVLCSACSSLIKPVVSHVLEITPSKSMKVFALAGYQEPLKKMIVAKSWSNHVAGAQLGTLLWQQSAIQHQPCDVLVPIPLHWFRYARRGYNQATYMARAFGKQAEVPVVSLLSRRVYTPFQSGLTAQERLQNVKQVFTLTRHAEKYRGKHIVLVDDLMTTGATLKMAAKELLKIKPASISAFVACRVV